MLVYFIVRADFLGSHLPFTQGERPASWWRSSLIICRRVSVYVDWVQFPHSPLVPLGLAFRSLIESAAYPLRKGDPRAFRGGLVGFVFRFRQSDRNELTRTAGRVARRPSWGSFVHAGIVFTKFLFGKPINA